jgi:hypothetical protein
MKIKDFVFFPGLILEIPGILLLVTGLATGSDEFLIIGVGLLCSAVLIHAFRIIRKYREGIAEGPPEATKSDILSHPGESGVLYSDSLVTIAGDSITFHHYSFPFFTRERKVMITDIDHIDVKKPSVLAGKWRIGGSGNLSTWFPWDLQRPSRDRIYHAFVKTKGMNIGFTVERPNEVTAILKKKGLMGSDEVAGW